MKTKAWLVASTIALASSLNSPAQTQVVKAPPPPAPPSATEKWIQNVKNPEPWFSWGFDFRVRNEYINNMITHNPDNPLREQDYFRFRARLWTSVKPVTNVAVNVRLATEPRYWVRDAGYTVFRGQSGMDWTEGVFDNAYVQWKNILEQPVSLSVGRQDLFIGDGWLVGDGTPNDGSWTYFLDSARLTIDLKPQKTSIDIIGIWQNAEDDSWIPTINNQNRYLTDQNERGAILYVSNKSIPAANVDAYFMYKRDERLEDGPATGDDANIYTLGARVSGAWGGHWKYVAEGAFQFGEKRDPRVRYPADGFTGYRDLEGFGMQGKLTYAFNDALKNQLGLAAEYISGDDPETRDDEMFDVLWGRWPHWAEAQIYAFAAETRAGQLANIVRVGPFWSLVPFKNSDFTLSYNALFAPQDTPTRGAPGIFSNDGNFRGHFLASALKYKFTPRLSGHLWGELLFPGDYYTYDSMESFLRAEIMFVF